MGYHAILYAVAFTIPAALGFATYSTLTHFLSLSEYGIYSTTLNLAFFVNSFFFGWIRFSAGRFEAEHENSMNVRFWLRCYVLMLPISAATLALVSMFRPIPLGILSALFFLSAAQGMYDLSQEFRRARKDSGKFATYNIVRSLAGFASAVTIAMFIPSGAALLLGLAASFLVFAVLNLISLSYSNHDQPRQYNFSYVLKFGSALAISGLVFSSMSVIARLIITALMGSSIAGAYNAALDLASQVGGIVAMSAYSIIAPSVIKSYATEGVAGALEHFRRGGELLLATMLPATVGLMIVSGPLVYLVTGAAFHEVTSEMLPLMILSVCIGSFNNFYLHIAFQITSKPSLQVMSGVFQVICITVSNYVLIRAYGAVGGGIALIVSSTVGLLTSFILARSVFPVPIPIVALMKIAVCTAGMAATASTGVHMGQTNIAKLGYAVALGVSTYGILAFLLDICGIRRHLTKQGPLLAAVSRGRP
jgi:O-antigen/teichoic acid export membrane protein